MQVGLPETAAAPAKNKQETQSRHERFSFWKFDAGFA